jgi:hypothetical protein
MAKSLKYRKRYVMIVGRKKYRTDSIGLKNSLTKKMIQVGWKFYTMDFKDRTIKKYDKGKLVSSKKFGK